MTASFMRKPDNGESTQGEKNHIRPEGKIKQAGIGWNKNSVQPVNL